MCPSDDAWAVFLYGSPSPADRLSLAAHLDGCDACREIVADVAAISRRTDPTQPTLLFGKYRLGAPIAVGGMSIVHEATHVALGRRVAIKMLGSELLHDPDARKRFEREARAVASLDSPYIVRVLDFDVTPAGRPLMVMEMVAGRDLSRTVEREGSLDAQRVKKLAIELAEALVVAHRAGIVHRDLKPHNVIIGPSGESKVVDFGLARWLPNVADRPETLTQEGAVVGTPQYLSPEQIRGEKADERTDIYGVGTTLYFAATGDPPFRAPNTRMLMARILRDPLRPVRAERLSFYEPLAKVIERCLARNRADRYRDANELLAALGQSGDPPTERFDASTTLDETTQRGR